MFKDTKNLGCMSNEERNPIQSVFEFVAPTLQAGIDEPLIAQRLEDVGMHKPKAPRWVDQIVGQVKDPTQGERVTIGSLILVLVGGLLASLEGGLLWAGLIIVTGYEFGYVAWGLGILSGYSVVLLANENKGIQFQVIAVTFSILGIFIGKYISYYYQYLSNAMMEGHGNNVASGLSMFSEEVFQCFVQNIGLRLNGFDVIWIILAVVTAWSLPQPDTTN